MTARREMLCQEFNELAQVAPIGIERLRRIAPLVAEMGEPVLELGDDFVKPSHLTARFAILANSL